MSHIHTLGSRDELWEGDKSQPRLKVQSGTGLRVVRWPSKTMIVLYGARYWSWRSESAGERLIKL